MRKKLLAGMLLLAVAIGLSACRGFFTQAPVAVLVYTPEGTYEAPITVTFDLSGSQDPDGEIVGWTLDFGDGSTPATGTDVTVPVKHTYQAEGSYTATLEVEDNAGKKDQASVVITVMAPRVYFSSNRYGTYEIFRVKLDGTEEKMLDIASGVTDKITPALLWNTRDHIALSGYDGTDWDIGVWELSDLGFEHLDTQTYSEIQPTWYCDGSKLAFASDQSGNWEIWTVEYPWGLTSTVSQLTTHTQTTSWALAPSYSPVNGDLVFVANEYGGTVAQGGSALWIWREGEAAPEVLYDSAGHDGAIDPGLGIVAGLPADGGLSTPAWSPDGTKIAFTSDQGGDLDIYVINADGTGLQNLNAFSGGTPNTTADEFDPWWVETGDAIAFVRDVGGGTYQVYVVDLNTGTVRQLSSAADSIGPASESP